jgi:hypothetical protein
VACKIFSDLESETENQFTVHIPKYIHCRLTSVEQGRTDFKFAERNYTKSIFSLDKCTQIMINPNETLSLIMVARFENAVCLDVK